MSTSPSTIDYILEQLSNMDEIVTARKMFGEYALYCGGKVVGLVCDDTLFAKITEPGKTFVDEYYNEGHAYPGAKASMMIDGDHIEDSQWLCELIKITAANVPFPRVKLHRASKNHKLTKKQLSRP
ncbi:MAG: TfoX/Sxy family protein [Patescibacteria group bacterium]